MADLLEFLKREWPGSLTTLSSIVGTCGRGVPRGQIVSGQFRLLRRHRLIERKAGQRGGVTATTVYVHTAKGLALIDTLAQSSM
jgi:hypothetical protein